MKIVLPIPPSANRYWRMWRGHMAISDEARAYKSGARLRAWSQGARPIAGLVSVSLTLYRAERRGDLDNRIKVSLDALQGVAYENDSQVKEIHARMEDDPSNPRLVVWVESAEPLKQQAKKVSCKQTTKAVNGGHDGDSGGGPERRNGEKYIGYIVSR